MERAIKIAYDHMQGKRINFTETEINRNAGYELRRGYSQELSRFSCVECGQYLIPLPSKNKNIYFRHFPNSEDCILKQTNLKEEIIDGYRDTAFYGESPRHYELKNKIGELLFLQDGVEPDSIDIDQNYVLGEMGKRRRPDVYCIYNNKKVAFEIQLSSLSLHYILHRKEFYRDNGIYLIWIVDLMNSPKILKNFQLDIKYIWDHHNLFRLDESSKSNLFLDCNYKQSFIVDNNEVHQKWMHKKITLSDLLFDEKDFSCYYLNYFEDYSKKVGQLSAIKLQIAEEKYKQQVDKHKKEIDSQVETLVRQIKKYREQDYGFYSIFAKVNNFNNEQIEALNNKIKLDNFSKEGIPYFLKFIRDYIPKESESNMTIVEFLITCINIRFDINLKDKYGNGIIQYLYKNPYIASDLYKYKPHLFERKYKLTQMDEEFLGTLPKIHDITEYLELRYYEACSTLEERKSVRKMLGFLYFTESCKRGIIINSKVPSWVTYLCNVMSGYKAYWKYIIIVLQKTEIGEIIKKVDKKGTIRKKIKEYDLKQVSCSTETYSALVKIYPEFFI